jgi:uncharacterized membrane protein YfcA
MLPDNPELLALLFALAVFAGLIDTMAGGGGLLVVPGLMAAGLDPISAFATNKLQAIFGTASATVQFWRRGRVRLKDHLFPAGVAFLSAVCGAATLSYLEPRLLSAIVPFILISVALLLLLKPNLGEIARTARMSRLAGAFTLIPLIGFYDGFFGPGTGTFLALGAVAVLGDRLEEATIHAKIYNFTSNLGGLLFFIGSGRPAWVYGAVMAAGTLIGGNLGARLILKHGVGVIKPLIVAVSLALSTRLLWQQGTIQDVSKAVVTRLQDAQPKREVADSKPRSNRYRR